MAENNEQEQVKEETLSPAEDLKKKGNDAFQAKKFEEAIGFYSDAIKLEPENAVYYSNRSACYSSLKMWQKAYEDALLSVAKDPKFIKGYYRLSSAQTELHMFDDAEATLKAALTVEPENEVISRQIKALKTKRAAFAKSKTAGKTRQLDEAQMKEFMELQDQLSTMNKDLRSVKVRLATIQRDGRANAVTGKQVDAFDSDVPLYRAIGKAFFATPKDKLQDRLQQESAELDKTQKDLLDRQEYLERRIASCTTNLQELIK